MNSSMQIIWNRRIGMKGVDFLKHVFVDYGAARIYAKELMARGKKYEHWRVPNIHQADDENYARGVIAASAVNFCYPILENHGEKFSVLNPVNPHKPFSGAFALQHCFYRAFGENRITTASLYPHFETLEKTAVFFKGQNQIPLLEHRHWIMREVIEVVEERFNGDPINIFEEAGWDAGALVFLLVRDFPQAFGDDISRLLIFNGQAGCLEFPFYKKAKLTALLYQGRALEEGSRLKALTGMHNFAAIEDYQVPKLLRHKGVLVYSPELLEKVQNGKIICRNSREEIEIRSAVTDANAEILDELNKGLSRNHPDFWDIVPLDLAEWVDGRNIDEPHHITPTTAY